MIADKRKSLGRTGEDRACEFLEHKGYKILERNFRLQLGEVDIIAEKDDMIFFIEVKTRHEGDGVEFYSNKQRNRLMKVSEAYLAKKNIDKQAVVSLLSVKGDPAGEFIIELVHEIYDG